MKLTIFLSFTLLFTLKLTHSAQISPTISPISSPATPSSPSSSSSSSPLDPSQLRALQSLNIPLSKTPCNPTSSHNTTLCDNATPYRHLTSLHLTNCSDDVSITSTALKSLSTLQDLQLANCPVPPVRLPPELASNLRTFTCINSLKRLTGVWLSKLENVTDLTVSDVVVNASGPVIILGKLKKLKTVTIRNANLTGYLPKSWRKSITSIDLSGNELKGHIPSSITELESLVSLDLSSNKLNGELPSNIGDLIELRNLSVSSNSLSGSVPESVVSMPSLVHLDLSSNQFNGSVPKFLMGLKHLKYLNLEGNNFQGIMPFNESFIKKLAVFKIGENSNLCYNKTSFSSKMKLGISPCDKNGLPVSPPSKEVSSGDDDDYGDDGSSSSDDTSSKSGGRHGPNKLVLGVAIALSSIVFLIIFLILLSRRCA